MATDDLLSLNDKHPFRRWLRTSFFQPSFTGGGGGGCFREHPARVARIRTQHTASSRRSLRDEELTEQPRRRSRSFPVRCHRRRTSRSTRAATAHPCIRRPSSTPGARAAKAISFPNIDTSRRRHQNQQLRTSWRNLLQSVRIRNLGPFQLQESTATHRSTLGVFKSSNGKSGILLFIRH